MKKRIMAILKRRELYFVIIVYPTFLHAAKLLKFKCNSWTNENYNYYGFTSLCVMVLILFLVVLEVSMKLYGYGIQGDKLKIREREGISIGDINNGKK